MILCHSLCEAGCGGQGTTYYGEDHQPDLTTRYCGASSFWQVPAGQLRVLVGQVRYWGISRPLLYSRRSMPGIVDCSRLFMAVIKSPSKHIPGSAYDIADLKDLAVEVLCPMSPYPN